MPWETSNREDRTGKMYPGGLFRRARDVLAAGPVTASTGPSVMTGQPFHVMRFDAVTAVPDGWTLVAASIIPAFYTAGTVVTIRVTAATITDGRSIEKTVTTSKWLEQPGLTGDSTQLVGQRTAQLLEAT